MAEASIGRLRPEHWRELRDIRVEMLADEPTAFLELAADARALGDSDWCRRAAELATDEAAGFFAQGDDGWAGFAAVSQDGDAALIHAMYVRPPARGAGIAQSLLEAAMDWARAHGIGECALWVRVDNARARGLYERCGFRPTGVSRPYRFDAGFAELELRRRT